MTKKSRKSKNDPNHFTITKKFVKGLDKLPLTNDEKKEIIHNASPFSSKEQNKMIKKLKDVDKFY